ILRHEPGARGRHARVGDGALHHRDPALKRFKTLSLEPFVVLDMLVAAAQRLMQAVEIQVAEGEENESCRSPVDLRTGGVLALRCAAVGMPARTYVIVRGVRRRATSVDPPGVVVLHDHRRAADTAANPAET